MKNLPATPELLSIAERVMWFEQPARALSDPARFLAYLLTFGTHEEICAVWTHLGPEDLRETLEIAPAGVFDERSWAYWNAMAGRIPIPPMPRRALGEPV